MRVFFFRGTYLSVLLIGFLSIIDLGAQNQIRPVPVFEKITIDSVFRSESVTAADLNNDGLSDVFIGDLWYEAPHWIAHEIRTPGEFLGTVYSDERPSDKYAYYSNSFAVHTLDVNQDGWQDAVVYPVMDQPVYWYENRQGESGHWLEHVAIESYHSESPMLVDLYDDGNMGALSGVRQKDSLFHLCWSTPGSDPMQSWESFTIGHTNQSSYRGPGWNKIIKWISAGSRDHGLGVGDLNRDGRNDVLTRKGWYQAPEDQTKDQWAFHEIAFDSMVAPDFPQYQFAQMPIFDIDEDGDADFIGTSAHRHGLWWMEQLQKSDGTLYFVKHDIPFHMSQVHAVAMGDLNKNGRPDIVLGKRYLAHNGNDPGWDEPLHLLWLEPFENSEGETEFQISIIHTGVGVGTQIEIVDIDADGWDDVLVSNKKGTHLFRQLGK